MHEKFIPVHGGYKNLLSYQKSVIVYDATVYFCKRFISKFDRTYDQMMQAAHSGKQNVIIGLIKVTNKLLGNQIIRLDKDFVKEGGLRERMFSARLKERKKSKFKN